MGPKLLNCVIVALFLWLRAHGRTGLGVKRSVALHGVVPHFFHVKERGDNLVVVDYIPRKRKRSFVDEQGDSVFLFHGLYRVRVYALVSIATSDTLFGAYRDALARRKDRYD